MESVIEIMNVPVAGTRPVAGFPNYIVGPDGSVWSDHRSSSREWHRLTPVRVTSGYLFVRLYAPRGKISGGRKWQHVAVHRLVLEAFVGPCPCGMEACHWDGNPANNRVENLRWDTHRANCDDRDRHGRTLRGSQIALAKLTEADATAIRSKSAGGVPDSVLADQYGVSGSQISRIVSGHTWPHAGGPIRTANRRRNSSELRVCVCGRAIKGCAFFHHKKHCKAGAAAGRAGDE